MTTYTDGTIRKRNNHGKWEWQALIIAKEDGKKRQKTKMLGIPCDPLTQEERGSGRRNTPKGKGARQALTALKKWRDELIQDETLKSQAQAAQGPNTSKLVPDYVRYYWDSRNIEPGTRQHYEYLMKHIDCPLLQVPIADLTPTTVQEWKRWMEEQGVGASVQNKCFNQLKYACKFAVEMQQLDKNPCTPVKAPKRTHHEPNPLDEDAVTTIREKLDEIRESNPVMADAATLALLTGMRQGEICALRWDDVDGASDGTLTGHIHVRNVIAGGPKGNYIKDYPKNRERRDVPINDPMREVLARRLADCKEFVDDVTGTFVFPRTADPWSYASPSYLSKQWSMFARMSKVVGVNGKPPRFHDLRDTFATQALIHGIDIVSVASILGHRDTSTTLRHYARWLPNSNVAAMDRMGDVLS